MATAPTKLLTADEFWDFVHRPENDGKLWELEDGEVVEMPSPSEFHGILCAWIAHLLWDFAIRRGKGRVCSNDTGLVVRRNPDTVRGADVMFFDDSKRLEDLSRKFAQEVPRLVVEVLSPSDRVGKVNKRVGQYLRRGIPLVWLVDSDTRVVTVYRPGQEHQTLDETDVLTGGDVLPDFRCRVAEFFNFPGQSS
jgi:Uma2 family endonuclease